MRGSGNKFEKIQTKFYILSKINLKSNKVPFTVKKLSQLIALLFLLSQNSKAQTDVLNDERIAPLLKQAAAGRPELVISGRKNASTYVNMAVLDRDRKMLTWFTCYGRAFDSAKLTDIEYSYIITKTITPFDFYKQFCLENIAYPEDAESHFRQFGKDALKDTSHNRQVVYNAPAVRSASSTLQKVMAMENLLKKQCLQLALFNSKSPAHAHRSDSFLLRKSLAGKMVRKDDTTTYYNNYLLGSAAKIILYKQSPQKLFVYNRQEQVIDSVPLKPEKYASLLKEKEDVFLLYRGWLELQSQQLLDARRQVNGLLNTQDTSLFTQTKLQDDQKALWHSMLQLEEQQLAIEQKISNLLMPDQQTVKSMLQNANPDSPSEVSYLEGLGFAYTTSYTRGEKVYELTDHRGNVMATVSDKKKGIDENQDGVIEYYNADVVNSNDYYPFGMLEPGRSYSADSKYRYGYNGKENDNEVKGEGNQQDYGMRVYDPRVGRFLSVDPLTKQYAELTPYQYASNMPIEGVDLDGLEHMHFQLIWDNKTRNPQLKLTNQQNVRHEWMTGKDEKLPLAYFVQYKGKEYRFFAGGRLPYLPQNSIENFNSWHSNYKDYKNKDGSTKDFNQVFGSNEDWNHGLGNDILDEAQDALIWVAIARAHNSQQSSGAKRQLKGAQYEEFLKTYLGGERGFKVGGRDFDGRYGTGKGTWYEAKSGDFFTKYDLNKFKSDMGSRLKIAQDNGVKYELWSEGAIPKEAKDYLDSKGIKYYENIKSTPQSIQDL